MAGKFVCRASIPLTLGSVLPRRFGAGAWEYHNMAGYTSTGVGSSIVTVRINCLPEITLHRLWHARRRDFISRGGRAIAARKTDARVVLGLQKRLRNPLRYRLPLKTERVGKQATEKAILEADRVRLLCCWARDEAGASQKLENRSPAMAVLATNNPSQN